ncbi:MAG: TraR/DksA C4-type zinc finger protein [Peptococcaceae bacterium]|nr:TraR/DksA C4-type zinc finger protein [Peptococcaceae bacterium]
MCQVTDWEKALDFHGHACPGLAVGYRAALAALRELGANRSPDEQLVAIVENDACGVDAIQVLTGCTFGKGNLVFRDYGKHVYTIGRRDNGKAVRVSVKRSWSQSEEYKALREKVFSGNATEEERKAFARMQQDNTERILEAPEEEILDIKHIPLELPRKARIFKSVECAVCGETVMEPRARLHNGQAVCIPCSEEYRCVKL